MSTSRIFNIGNRFATNEYEKNNLVITNFAFSIGSVASGLFVLYLLLTHDFISALVIGIGFLLCILGFVLNAYGKFSWALVTACSITGLVIPIHNWYYPNTGVTAYLLTATVIVSFLSAQKPKLRFFLILYTFLALVFCVLTIIFRHKGISINKENQFAFVFNVISALTSIAVAVGYFGSLMQKQQIRFENLNHVKNRLLAVLVHDIRGPLNNLVQITELLNQGELNKEDSDKIMLTLSREVKSTTDLLDDVLIWIRGQMQGLETNKVLFNVNELVKKVITENKVKAEMKGISIEVTCNKDVMGFADKDLVALAMRNLMGNAVKFAPIKTGLILVDISGNESETMITIRNNGPGISDAEIQKIKAFKSFTSYGSDDEKGFGVGLFLTQQFLSSSDARLEVSNNADEGAKFSIILPNS